MCCSYFIIWRVADGRAWSQTVMASVASSRSEMEFRKPSIVILTRNSTGGEECPEVEAPTTAGADSVIGELGTSSGGSIPMLDIKKTAV